MRLRPAWRGCDVAYLTPEERYGRQPRDQPEREGATPPRFYVTVSANRWQKLRLLRQLLTIARIVVRERPAVVCTTGEASGYFAIPMGKMLGTRTIWIDSIANAGEISPAGRKAGK
jgi:hypothetical protein